MNKKFAKLGLSKEMLDVLDEAGFEAPTEIQEKAIPLALEGKDIIGGSATGSGKTLVFAAPIIENLKPSQHVQALILAPTRELAEQIAESIKQFSKNKKLNVTSVYGGVDIVPQMKRIARADVVVATPGRVLDHINRRTLRLDHVRFLVLDEVDRMFDMGFHRDVERIIDHCSKQRQTMLFSATISADIDYLAKKHTKNPVEIAVKSYVDHSKLKQIYYDVPPQLKFSLLVHLLKKETSDLVMVFCSTRRNVDFVVDNLNQLKLHAQAIHGGLAQNKRKRVLESFHGKGANILVCTDVAARGLDIKGVSHVYNYDLPPTSNDYIHRIGRTARAGKAGKAISILASRDYENFGMITRDDSLKIDKEELPFLERVMVRKETGNSSGRFGGESRGPRNSSGRFGGRSQGGRDSGRSNRGRSEGGRNSSRSDGGRDRPRSNSGRFDSRSGGSRNNSGRSGGSRNSSSRFGGRNDRGRSGSQKKPYERKKSFGSSRPRQR